MSSKGKQHHIIYLLIRTAEVTGRNVQGFRQATSFHPERHLRICKSGLSGADKRSIYSHVLTLSCLCPKQRRREEDEEKNKHVLEGIHVFCQHPDLRDSGVSWESCCFVFNSPRWVFFNLFFLNAYRLLVFTVLCSKKCHSLTLCCMQRSLFGSFEFGASYFCIKLSMSCSVRSWAAIPCRTVGYLHLEGTHKVHGVQLLWLCYFLRKLSCSSSGFALVVFIS